MTGTAIQDKLIGFITAELLLDENYELGPDDELLLDGLIDSIGATRLVVFVETTWALSVAAQDVTVENFGSVDQIARYISDLNGG